jgi:hypothetical protein
MKRKIRLRTRSLRRVGAVLARFVATCLSAAASMSLVSCSLRALAFRFAVGFAIAELMWLQPCLIVNSDCLWLSNKSVNT